MYSFFIIKKTLYSLNAVMPLASRGRESLWTKEAASRERHGALAATLSNCGDTLKLDVLSVRGNTARGRGNNLG